MSPWGTSPFLPKFILTRLSIWLKIALPMKKETKRNETTMTAREVAVLVEDFRSQFRVFGEDLSAVKRKVDALFEEVSKQKEEIFIIKADINIIKGDIKIMRVDIAEIKETLKDHTNRIAHLEVAK